MIKVEIELCKHSNNEELCSPCLLVTEDNSDDSCPIILPENMETIDAILLTDKIKRDIEDKFETVAEVKKVIYGG